VDRRRRRSRRKEEERTESKMELQLAAYWCLQLVKGDVHVYTCSADSDLFRPIDPTGRAQSDPVCRTRRELH
jgi:hypothetical protein